MKKSVFIRDHFFSGAKELRGFFEDQYKDPYKNSSRRFVWDYWSVPDQYLLLRTPAYHFFPKRIYENFHQQLVWWGRRNLGCHDISPPWLSCYVNDNYQNLHTDVPHGPWAFVFSLTPWSHRSFRGGETVILHEEILNYWKSSTQRKGLEHRQILRTVEPKMNRLVVFDPRLPHGVSRVENAQSLIEGRLVIHGWFMQPRPFIEGPLREPQLMELIHQLIHDLETRHFLGSDLSGILSLRFSVSSSGEINQCIILSNTLQSHEDPEKIKRLVRSVKTLILNHRFSKYKKSSLVTLPLIFENE